MSKCYDDPRPTIQERLREWSGTPILNLKMPVLREAADEIDRLRAELAEKDKRIAELERQVVLSGWNDFEGDITGLNIFTDDQINAAWERGKKQPDQNVNGYYEGLWSLGIVPCNRCGGTNLFMGDPCTCPNNGWVMEER